MYKGTIILEGGATRGVYTAGVLDYFMKKNLTLSNVIGVSAGACNAVDYKSQQIGRSKDCMIIVDKDKEYYAMFGNDWNTIGLCLGYVIFDKDFNYIDFVIC